MPALQPARAASADRVLDLAQRPLTAIIDERRIRRTRALLIVAVCLALSACRSPSADQPNATAVPAGVSDGTAGTSDPATDTVTQTLTQTTEAQPDADRDDGASESGLVPGEHGETDLVRNARQLIFDGARSGEGYFSADGRYMVFQSEREADNPFYQIYLLDLETGDTQRISPGVGKTTCAWIHPDGQRVLFASTHEDPEAEADMAEEFAIREEGDTRRYAWDYDEDYEIYEVPIGGDDYTQLTDARGYDAEGSWSPDGSKIAFASNRAAYEDGVPAELQETFERDPSVMMDIYIMDGDGGNVERLTESPGYDGGPFFSPDGQRIVWRRFNEAGDQAEVWTMAIDGSDQRQITDLGAMSWAPFYHPSGDYIIFATSVHGFQNFELYMVDSAGTKEPVRVTFTDGPDVLPVFSPDGATVSWSTRRGVDGESQIFVADWDDAAARELLELAPGRGEARYGAGDVAVAAPDMVSTVPEIRAEDARLHVERLTADEMGGRLTGTSGEAMATAYVAEVFEALELEPAGSDGFFDPFTFTSGVSLRQPSVLSLQPAGDPDAEGGAPELTVGEDWLPLAFSKTGSVGFSEIVFAGYGIVAPEVGEQAAYDSYGELDVTDKWVLALRYIPEDIEPERRQHLARYSMLRFKAMEARDRGAAGLIVVSGPRSQVREELVALQFDASVAGTQIPAVSVTDDVAEALFADAPRSLEDAQAALDGGEEIVAFPLPAYRLGAHIELEVEESTGRNVVGRLVVGDTPSDEVVVIGAHIDHLGRGEGGDSLARDSEEGAVHPGADDNASGIAAMIEIAQWLGGERAAGELDDVERDVVFAAWSGEELGLLGSSHWVKQRLIDDPDGALTPEIAAYLNMDMVGRMDDALVLQGVASSPFWAGAIERRNVVVGLPVTLSDDTYLPTDATSFYLRGVPILAAFTGAHEDYHSPRDTADKLDYDRMSDIARLVGLIGRSAAAVDEAPAYVEIAASQDSNRRVGRVFLGTIPDYGNTDAGGVLLSGVSAEGPADEAGLQSGDIIVGLAGQEIGDIYEFTRVLDALEIGETVEIVVLRDGERVPLEITPSSRD